MAVPRNRTSNAKKNSRRAHHAKSPVRPAICSNCKSYHLPHRICSACGHYLGKQVVNAKN